MKMAKIISLVLLTAVQIFSQSRDYEPLHSLLIKFYGYQRAGLKSGSAYNRNPGFSDASHKGDSYNGSPLDGGWYDAGDYIKFGMNLGYTVYCLLKGYDVFPSGYDNKYAWNYSGTDAIPDVLNEVKFATDYMMKAVIDANTVVLDVGIASEEHATWGVTNASGRTGSKIKLCNGGDIPATYAACLALMATVYRKYDEAYADECVKKAKIAFAFAKKKIDANNLYCTPQLKAGQALYDYPTVDGKKDRQIADRMVAAGVELYRATKNGDPIYQTWATKSIPSYYNCMGYTFIGPLASFEVWRQGLGGAGSLSSNIGFIESKIKTSGTFAKVYQNSGWGTARDMGSVAFEYALGYITTPSETARASYLQKAIDHIDWLAGYSGRSYIVGFNNGPKSIHYRPNRSGPPGGVVSGPDGNGNWSDDGSAKFCEVAIDYNAGAIGAIAFLRALKNPGNSISIPKAFSSSPKGAIDFSKGKMTFSAGFSKSVKWTLTIAGVYGTKTYTGSGTSINQSWDGSADKGQFLTSETVSAALTIDENIAAYDILKTSALPILIEKSTNPSTTGVTVDDFEDSNLSNKIGGTWTAFGTGTGLRKTSTSFSADNGSKALVMRGTVLTNDNKSLAGVKTTISGSNSIKSIMFDLRGNKRAMISVELEQSDIADGAYHAVSIPIMTQSNTYKLNIADFRQPDWKSSEKPLDLGKVSSLRFTIYDSTGTINLYFDNVIVEGLNTSSLSTGFEQRMKNTLTQTYNNSSLIFTIPQQTIGIFNVAIFDIAGKNVLNKTFGHSAGKNMSLSLSTLPSGIYTVVNSLNNKPLGEHFKLVHTR